ncbi:MAG: HAD family hydrolase [Victivallales bacterium]|nr:HAD family hydrolase [Victivallales bacterium]
MTRVGTYSGNCRLVVSDIDETFVATDKSVPPRNLEALRRLEKAGIPFAFASGRYWPSLRQFTEKLGIKSPQIVDNGAMVIRPGDEAVLGRYPVGRECLDYFYFGLRKAGFIPLLSTGLAYHAPEMDQPLYEQLTLHAETADVLPEKDIVSRFDEYGKLVVFAQHRVNELEAAADKLLAAVPSHFRFSSVFTEQGIFVVTAENVSKASGVLTLCRELGCTPEDVVSVGDGDNDVEMLELTGRSFVVENGTARAKRAATDIVPSNNDAGFACAVDILLG